MSKIVEKLAASGHLTAEQVERIGHNSREFLSALRKDPELMEKAAAFLGALKAPLQTAAAGALLGTGFSLAGSGIGAIKEKITDYRLSLAKAKNYKAMLEANPELAANKANAAMVQRHFDTLHRFNPEYATDPVVAGTYVQNSLEFSRPNIEAINNIVNAHKNIQQAKAERTLPSPLAAGVPAAMKRFEETRQEQSGQEPQKTK